MSKPTPESLVETIPYARFLGMRIERAGDEMTAVLPFADHLVGNPMLPALHGGVVGGFMEIAAMAELALATGRSHLPRAIGVTVTYLRSAKPLTTWARARIKRSGRRVASVEVEAWQEDRSAPIASLHANFLLASAEDEPVDLP